MEMNLRTGEKKEEQGKRMPGTLDQYGVHVAVDSDFYERRQNIQQHFIRMSDEDIKNLNLTPKREMLLHEARDQINYVMYHAASGKGRENARFYKAASACRNLFQRVRESIDCDASDDDVYLNGMDLLAALDKLPVATFGTDNSTVMTSFVVQSQPGNPMQQPTMMPVQQLTENSDKPKRGGGTEYAGRAPGT